MVGAKHLASGAPAGDTCACGACNMEKNKTNGLSSFQRAAFLK